MIHQFAPRSASERWLQSFGIALVPSDALPSEAAMPGKICTSLITVDRYTSGLVSDATPVSELTRLYKLKDMQFVT
jgi:hypothetical protein